MHQDGTLAPVRARDRRNGGRVLVARRKILKFDHGVAVAEERCWCQGPGVEDHGSHVRRYGRVCVRGGVVHVRGHGSGFGVVDVVEEDAGHGDVVLGVGVVGPGRIDVDVGDDGRVGAVCVVRVNVAERLNVGVAVELSDGGDVVLVRRVAGRTRPAVGVHDDLPLHLWVGGDGGGSVVPI